MMKKARMDKEQRRKVDRIRFFQFRICVDAQSSCDEKAAKAAESGQTVELPKQRYRHLIYVKEPGAVVSGLAGEDGEGAKAGAEVRFDFAAYLNKDLFGKSTPQYFIANHENSYVDKNGLVRYRKTMGEKNENDYYCIAMAPGFIEAADIYCESPENTNINFGYMLRIEFVDQQGKIYSMDVIVSDEKHSSNRDDFYPHNSIVEFIVDGIPKGEITENGEDGDNVSFDKLLGDEGIGVEKIYSYEDEVLVTGNYLDGWILRGFNDEN